MIVIITYNTMGKETVKDKSCIFMFNTHSARKYLQTIFMIYVNIIAHPVNLMLSSSGRIFHYENVDKISENKTFDW